MSGDDEDRLDFGEDEELEDQISLGDADEAGGWNGNQQQVLSVATDAARQHAGNGADQAMLSAANDDAGTSEASLPAGWVTRVSRQGEMYYFHEATLLSQWDRPTEPVNVTVEAVETVAPEARSAKPVRAAAAAATKFQDNSKSETAPEASREGQTSSKWGRQNQPLQTQAFTSRSTDTSVPLKSAREVAAAASSRQSATSSGTSRAQPQSEIAEASGRASPAVSSVPTGPRNARDPPAGPRGQQQEPSRWSAREPQDSQSRISSLPTGPAADRSRPRAPPPQSSRPFDRDPSGPATLPPRHPAPANRGDSGWPVREPVGPPADLHRASTTGFRGPPAGPSAPHDARDRGYDDDRRYPRTDLGPRERVQDSGYRNPAPAAREMRSLGLDSRDEGWSRRPLPKDLPVGIPSRRRDPSPPRRARSPLPVRREPIAPERRRRSPSPVRTARDYPDSRARPAVRDYPANIDRTPRRARRSPSPPPMRKWAVRAITPPPSEEVNVARPEVGKKVDNQAIKGEELDLKKDSATATDTISAIIPKAASPSPRTVIEATEPTTQRQNAQSCNAQPTLEQSTAAISAPETKEESGPQSKEVPPLKLREKRPMSPGLASRLDRPLSQPAPRDTRPRGGRTPPPRQRPSRRSPSPDGQRKRTAPQAGASLAERMGGGQPSLLSRLGENGRREGQNEGRPPKRSRKDETGQRDQHQDDMQVDHPELSRRLQGTTRSRSRTPPSASRGIAIFGASRNSGAAATFNDRNEDVKPATSIGERLNGSVSQEQSSQRPSDTVGSEVTADKGSHATAQDTTTSSSNGAPARPAGFASLPPRPPVIVPPHDFSNRGPPPRGGSSTPNPVLLDSYRPGDRPGPPPRRPSSRGPPVSDSYSLPPSKEGPILDRYVPRREPPPGRSSRPRSPPPSRGPPGRGPPRRDYR